ncbi:MAG: iron-containing redox enzyme family protein [Planctomycetes bacterium]|nr:iron-containing redox enzyme family protein [Planctomycetota bacterium]
MNRDAAPFFCYADVMQVTGAAVEEPLTGRAFLARLRREVASHPGVGHSLLGRMAMDPRSREDFRVLGEQHYPLVSVFTRYLELLLLRAPDAEAKCWIAKVLVDEYGERSEGEDHASHYRRFLRSAGVPDGAERTTPIHPAGVEFIEGHLKIVTEEPFLVGLGAVGPGHEWAIPAMFDWVLKGLRAAGFADAQIGYFLLHVEQDKDHGAWLEESLAVFATTREACALIRRGALASLALREQFWWGVADKLHARRMRERTGLIPSTAGSEETQVTLDTLLPRIAPRIEFGPSGLETNRPAR